MQTEYGQINDDGTIGNLGSNNWSVTKGSTGIYNITFNTTFASTPVIIAGAYGDTDSTSSDNVFSVYDVSTSGFSVVSIDVGVTTDPGWETQDSAFSFMAMG